MMKKRRDEHQLWKILADAACFFFFLGLATLLFCRAQYAQKCIQDWMGDEFCAYSGTCQSIYRYSSVYDRLNSGYYIEMNDGTKCYIKSDFYFSGDYRSDLIDLDELIGRELRIVTVPQTWLYYNGMAVAILCNGEELLNSRSVYSFMAKEEKTSRLVSVAVYVVLCFPFSLVLMFRCYDLCRRKSNRRKKQKRFGEKQANLRAAGKLHPRKQWQKKLK